MAILPCKPTSNSIELLGKAFVSFYRHAKTGFTVYVAFSAKLSIAIMKFVAAFITRSSTMLSEGIHSCVDSGVELLLLLGLKRSKKKPDAAHPFGYGKELYFWTLIMSVLIFALGGGLAMYEGITHIMHPEELTDP